MNLDVLREELERIPGVKHVSDLEGNEVRITFDHRNYGRTINSMRVAIYTAYGRAAERTIAEA
jgi:hypothetical protein